MKSVWRRECCEPDNTFYIQNPGNISACIAALQPFIIGARRVTHLEQMTYMKHVPKASIARKRVADTTEKFERMYRLEAMLRTDCMQRQTTFADTTRDDLLDLLDDALARTDAGTQPVHDTSTSTTIPPPPLLFSPDDALYKDSMQQPLVKPRVVVPASPVSPTSSTAAPLSVASTASTSSTTVTLAQTSSPTRKVGVQHAYEHILEWLIAYDYKSSIQVTDAMLKQFLNDHQGSMLTPYSMMTSSRKFDYLVGTMGISGSPQLLMKPFLTTWIANVQSKVRDRGACQVTLAFYVPPSLDIYTDMFVNSSLPDFVYSGVHRVETQFDKACARAVFETKPFIVAVYGDRMPMVPGSQILLLGVVVY